MNNKDVPVDIEAVKEFTGGNRDIFEIVLKAFFEDEASQLEDIGKAVKTGDPKVLDNAAHKYKSSLYNVGALEAAEIAAGLERMGKGGSMDEAEVLLGTLYEKHDALLEYLKSSDWMEAWDRKD